MNMHVTVIGVYDEYHDACEALDDLVGPGFDAHELQPRGELFLVKVIADDVDHGDLANQVMTRHHALEVTERSEQVDYLAYWKRAYQRARQ